MRLSMLYLALHTCPRCFEVAEPSAGRLDENLGYVLGLQLDGEYKLCKKNVMFHSTNSYVSSRHTYSTCFDQDCHMPIRKLVFVHGSKLVAKPCS